MRRQRRLTWGIRIGLAALALHLGSPRASAQYAGVGTGPRGPGLYGGFMPGFMGFGYFPGAYQSFWTNGFSLYGPPVPTYGTIPGFFGGSDQRLNNINITNGAGIGLGNSGAGGAGPRRRHWAQPSDGLVYAQPQQPYGLALIDVRVPAADAEVFFEGVNTKQVGERRMFKSPQIEVGTTYFYQIRARWKNSDGEVTEQTRSVPVRANETVIVNFSLSDSRDEKPIIGRDGDE